METRTLVIGYEDKPKGAHAAQKWLEEHKYPQSKIELVAKLRQDLKDTLTNGLKDQNLIVICGGTGLADDNFSPEVISELSDFEIPGFGELIRRESEQFSPKANLSRCGAWAKDGRLILAIAGGANAACEQLTIIDELMNHALCALRKACTSRTNMQQSRSNMPV